MEANTVILSLSDYNSLREFKENVESKGKRVVVYGSHQEQYGNVCYTHYNSITTYFTTDDALIQIAQRNDELVKVIDDLNKKIHRLEHPDPTVKELSISDVKKMSIGEFMKWRKT